MKVYVAGKWQEKDMIKVIMEELVAQGHAITADWTGHIYPEKSNEYSLEDLHGVKDCDVLLAYMMNPRLFYKGAWVEVGMALAFNKLVMIVGEDVSCVFLGHPNVYVYGDVNEAISVINDIHKGVIMYDDMRVFKG